MLAAKCTRASSLEKKHQMHICTFICTLGRNESCSGCAWPETVLVTLLIAHPELGEALSSRKDVFPEGLCTSCLPGSEELCLGRAPRAGCSSLLCHIPTWQGWVRPRGSGRSCPACWSHLAAALSYLGLWLRAECGQGSCWPREHPAGPWQRDRAGFSLQGEAGAGSAGVCVQERV